jgi:hypothetical protein
MTSPRDTPPGSAMRDGQAMFDVPLQVAHGRISALHADGGEQAASSAARRPAGRSRLRQALGVRLLALGAAVLAEEPGLGQRRRAARG